MRARTIPIDNPRVLDLAKLSRRGGLAWIRDGEGLLGWGEVARLEISGPDRYVQAAAWWERQCAGFEVADAVEHSGTGPIAFASFGFSEQTTSILTVPRVVLGIRGEAAWLTVIDTGAEWIDPAPEPLTAPGDVAWDPGDASEQRYLAGVVEAVRRIAAGDAEKVVLARELVARASASIDPRYLLDRLASRFPECWSFLVEDLVGATPELLISRTGAQISSRVLAGTAWPGKGAAEADHLADQLLLSEKDLAEHAYTAGSVASALAPYCDELVVPDGPDTIRLANVLHLSTQLDGVLSGSTSILKLVDALHPTPAVGGVPTKDALVLISELEPTDRGRYAAPVGWVDASGGGEFGIALRCAQLSGNTARLYAGCGIVADSVPERELAESDAKFSAVRDALTGERDALTGERDVL